MLPVGPVLELGILGPFEVRVEHGPLVALGGTRQAALLAVLGLNANQVVSRDRLIDELWGEHPPATAAHTIQVFVSRLRSALGAAGERLITRTPGYVLELGPDELDAARFNRLYERGRAALNAGDHVGASALLEAATALWRGPPLAEFTYEPFAQATIARLEELRVSCREEVIETELALGRHAEVVSDLEELVHEHPLRERPRGQLMLALYRCGRQAEALEAFQQARRMLLDELALDPSPALQELEQRILQQDPSLTASLAPAMATSGAPVGDVAKGEMSAASTMADDGAAEEVDAPRIVRRTVTVLVARFDLTVRADPEVARERISVGREEAEGIIRRHGGIVVSRLGGEVLGVFGLPATREDDALRALRSAEELLARVAELPAEDGPSLVVSAFVDTGEVVAEGSGDLSGEPVSTAMAQVHAASESEVLMSDRTRGLVSGSIAVEPALDGDAWRLLSVIRETPALRHADEPMVDRFDEMELTRSTFEHAVRSRHAHLLTVLGEAGIGKSRLAQEAADELCGDATVLTGRCLSYGDGVAFWPLREALTQGTGGDSREVIRGLLNDADDADVVAEIVTATLGLAPAERVGEQVPWAFRRLLEEMAGERPVILVLEDIHWGEGPLLDLVDYLVDWLTVPVLLLCLARPELLDVRPAWGGGHPCVSSLVLAPLDDGDARTMLDQNLGARRLSGAQSARILEVAEGNPLFVEQLLRTTTEDPLWDQARQVPATIQSLLAARLDRLGPGERAYIERAAVIGREFWPAAIVDLLPAEGQPSAGEHLRALVRRGLIHPDRSILAGEEQLRFHHILIRDVAYHTTPMSVRADLHERFADWLARRGEQYDEFTGYHLEQAFRLRGEVRRTDAEAFELAARAADHLASAGRRAALRGEANAAVSLLGRSADLFAAAGRTRPDVLLDFGHALNESGDFPKAERTLEAALDQAEDLGEEGLSARVRIELSYWRSHVDPAGGVKNMQAVAEAAIAVFERLGDESGLARAWLHMALAHWIRSDSVAMESALERALNYAERAGERRDRSRILIDLARTTVIGPRPVSEGIRRGHEILARADGDIAATAFTEAMLAVLEAMDGRFDDARERWWSGKRSLVDVGLDVTVAVIQMYYAFIELIAGTPENAVPELAESCATFERIGARGHLSSAAALAARLICGDGRGEEYERYRRISLESTSGDDVVSQVLLRGTHARLLVREGEAERAEEMANSAVSLAAGTDFLMLHGDALRDRAEVLNLMDKPNLAARDLEQATVLYERKGIRPAAEAARRALDSLAVDPGTPRRA